MTALTTAEQHTSTRTARRETRHPDLAVVGRALRQVWKAALVVAFICGATAASSALTYASTYPDAATRQVIADSLRGDAGFGVLLGPVDALDTIGGYTTYKTYVSLTTICAIWGALAATRLLRGEEDSGRWQLVLAGRTTPARATLATAVALAAAVGIVFAGTAALTMAAGVQPQIGFDLAGTLLFALSIALAAAMFAAVAALCSQLAQTRRLASGLSMGVIGAAFVIRMLADAGPGERWLLWATPFGWIQLMRPLTANDPWPIIPAVALIAACTTGAMVLAARRDAGSGLLATGQARPLRPFGLRTPLGLAVRLNLPVICAWAAAVAVGAFTMGIIGKTASRALPDESADIIERLGAGGTGPMLLRYYGVVFLLLAGVLALVPASQIGSAREEESSRRLPLVFAALPTRTAWLAGRLVLATVAVTGIGVLAGAAAWIGGASQGLEVSFGSLVVAGLNIVPTALLVLAIAALVLAIAPRFAVTSVYVIVTWSFCVELFTSLVTGLAGLARLSLFHYLTLAPAQDPDWRALAAMTAIAVAVSATAVMLFARRDLAGE